MSQSGELPFSNKAQFHLQFQINTVSGEITASQVCTRIWAACMCCGASRFLVYNLSVNFCLGVKLLFCFAAYLSDWDSQEPNSLKYRLAKVTRLLDLYLPDILIVEAGSNY